MQRRQIWRRQIFRAIDQRVFFWRGADEVPILLGVAAFRRHLWRGGDGRDSCRQAQAMSSDDLPAPHNSSRRSSSPGSASGLVIVAVVFVVNLRHALYSASMAPHVKHLGPRGRRCWRTRSRMRPTRSSSRATTSLGTRAGNTGSSRRRIDPVVVLAGLHRGASWPGLASPRLAAELRAAPHVHRVGGPYAPRALHDRCCARSGPGRRAPRRWGSR